MRSRLFGASAADAVKTRAERVVTTTKNALDKKEEPKTPEKVEYNHTYDAKTQNHTYERID